MLPDTRAAAWQRTQETARMGWTSRKKSTVRSGGGAAGPPIEARTTPPLASASPAAMTVPNRWGDMVSSGVLRLLDRAFGSRCQTDGGWMDNDIAFSL